MIEATEAGIGLELVQVKTTEILYENLNAEIDKQADKWIERDVAWNQLTGQLGETVIEHVDEKDFYTGHKPSLVKNPIPFDSYPNVCTLAYEARPKPLGIVDQASNYQIVLDIEILVKGEQELEAERRSKRTTEAVHQVLLRHENLGGYSLGWENDPNVKQTDLFVYENIFWTGSRIRYNLTRHNKLPS